MRRLVAVFAHPDDEALFAGGLLKLAASGGAHVELLTLTRGEAGHSRFGERGEALAARRARELEAACRVLGVHAHTMWDWPDAALAARDGVASAQAVHGFLAAREPHVVVSFGPDGGYGHADHVFAHGCVRGAVAQLPRATRLLETAFDRGLWRPTRRRLARFVPEGLLPVAEDALGNERGDAELVLTLGAWAEPKRRALQAHASQLPRGDPDRMLAEGLLERLCTLERYRVASGPELPRTTDDPFEALP